MNSILRVWYRGCLCTAIGANIATIASAQLPRPHKLAEPWVELSEDFITITSIRELRDGRVLITDPRGQRLVLADFTTNRIDTIGRVGSGPGEYSVPASLVALGGDSTLMPITGSRRWLLLDGARIVATLPPDDPGVRNVSVVEGADLAGHLMSVRTARPHGGRTVMGARDSVVLTLWDRRTAKEDTVGRLRVREATQDTEMDSKGAIMRISLKTGSPLAMRERAALFPDGWIAVARREPYRVDWRTPDGRWQQGPPLPFDRVRVDASEKAVIMQHLAERSGQPAASPDTYDGWPEFYPPYLDSPMFGIVPAPDGRLLIRRTQTSKLLETRYDVVNRRGALADRLVLAQSETIVGFGRGTVYVERTDSDGVKWLSRRKWP